MLKTAPVLIGSLLVVPLLNAALPCLVKGADETTVRLIPPNLADNPNIPQPAEHANGEGIHDAVPPTLIDSDPVWGEDFGEGNWAEGGAIVTFNIKLIADDTYVVNSVDGEGGEEFHNDDSDNCIELKVTYTYWYPVTITETTTVEPGGVGGGTSTTYTYYKKGTKTYRYGDICECPPAE